MSKSPSIFRKQSAPNDPPGSDVDDRIRQIEQRRQADVLEILELERRGARRDAPDPRQIDIEARAAALLGDKQPAQPSKSLADLYADRDACDQALVIAGRRSIAEHGRIVEQRVVERLPDWNVILRERAVAVAHLRNLNRQADLFIAALSSGGQRGGMPGEFPSIKLLGHGNAGVDALRFLELAVKTGVVTQQDIENA